MPITFGPDHDCLGRACPHIYGWAKAGLHDACGPSNRTEQRVYLTGSSSFIFPRARIQPNDLTSQKYGADQTGSLQKIELVMWSGILIDPQLQLRFNFRSTQHFTRNRDQLLEDCTTIYTAIVQRVFSLLFCSLLFFFLKEA